MYISDQIWENPPNHPFGSKLIFCQKRYLLRLILPAHNMGAMYSLVLTLVSRHNHFFNVLEELRSKSIARHGLRLSVYYSIVRLRANQRYSFCYQNSLSPVWLEWRICFSTRHIHVVRKESCGQLKAPVKISQRQRAQV